MLPLPPSRPRPYPLSPYPTLFRSKAADPRFRRGIARYADAALKGQHRGDVDDLARPPLLLDTRDHVPPDRLAEEEERLEIGVHHRVPIRFGEVDRVGAADDAGIVDQYVDAAECGERRVDERLHRGDARQVGVEIDRKSTSLNSSQ